MADYLWLEKFDTYTNVNNIPVYQLIEVAPRAARHFNKQYTVQKG